MILATGAAGAAADASYVVDNISLEFDFVNLPDLARMIGNQGELAILYDRVLRYRRVTKDKSDTLLNRYQRARPEYEGVLMLFEAAQQPFARDTEAFHKPKLTKVEVTIEGVPNQLYS